MTAYPTCSTCKHFQFREVLDMIHLCDREVLIQDLYQHGQQTFQPPTPSFGCVLHSDLTEAGA